MDGSLFQTDILFREADPEGAGARSFLVGSPGARPWSSAPPASTAATTP